MKNTLKSPYYKTHALFLFPKKAEFLLEQGLYIDPEFFEKALKGKYILGLIQKKTKISDLRRKEDKKVYSLDKSPIYQYLKEYPAVKKISPRFESLIHHIEEKGFAPNSFIICKYQSNLIRDGQHRAIYMLYKFGPDYELNTLHIRVKKDLLRFKICPWLKKFT